MSGLPARESTYKTRTGRILTDADVEALAEEIKMSDYDIEALRQRTRREPEQGD